MANFNFQGKIIRQFWGKIIRQSTIILLRAVCGKVARTDLRGGYKVTYTSTRYIVSFIC